MDTPNTVTNRHKFLSHTALTELYKVAWAWTQFVVLKVMHEAKCLNSSMLVVSEKSDLTISSLIC